MSGFGQYQDLHLTHLQTQNTHHTTSHDKLDIIALHATKRYYTGKILLSSIGGIASYADTLPVPSNDLDNRNGWLHEKTIANTDKLNYYFYSEGNIPLKLNEITNLKAIISVDNYTNTQSLPFFVVYTKMTGVGDAGVWYHSKRSYSLTADERIVVGEKIQMYSINKKVDTKAHRQVQFNNTIDTGDCDGEEEILTISIQSDSGSPIDTKILINSVGYETSHAVEINLELEAINSFKVF
jgi:hypothetical protein